MAYIRLRSVAPGTPNNREGKSDVGHAWVEISPTPGIPADRSKWESHGFYPESSSTPGASPTSVKTTDAADCEGKGWTTEWFYIPDAQAEAARDFSRRAEQEGWYSLVPFTYLPIKDQNCASFATEMAANSNGVTDD